MKVKCEPAIRVSMMPRDTNAHGTIFGGIILSYIDQAGAIAAYNFVGGTVVTVAMKEVKFHHPVFVGDIVSFYSEVLKIGNTSITVRVVVEAERPGPKRGKVVVTEAEVVYVHVDDKHRPLPIKREYGR